ncbi:hypothetical protein AVEN_267176-1 [Araneus ventricosus]|uniref:Uncharacterized protein n=1 Tax=Araneus ventricosus TaxID=182803 RepID=A0A4Y2PN73_ARAVE|nr:hypothetical protein AVEN_267176-1 [Araneus ventricosus]
MLLCTSWVIVYKFVKTISSTESIGIAKCFLFFQEVILWMCVGSVLKIIYITKQSDEELEDVLTYELCPFPLPLFDEGGMRKDTKSSLYKAFKPCTRDFNAESSGYIVDGGYLLHKVNWKKGSTFSSICDNHVTYVRAKYKSTALVIFYGYPENETVGGTK